jgi:hypothetical protein
LYDSSSYVKFLENELIHSHSRSMAAWGRGEEQGETSGRIYQGANEILQLMGVLIIFIMEKVL